MWFLPRIYLITSLLYWLTIPCAISQDKYKLFINDDTIQEIDTDELHDLFQKNVSNRKDLDQFMLHLYESGYLMAAYEIHEDKSIVEISTGPQFKWVELDTGNLPHDLQVRAGIKAELFKDAIFNFEKISGQFRKIIRYSENNGYPFAKIRLNKIKISGEQLSAEVDFEPGPRIRFKGIRIAPEAGVKTAFLENYLNIKSGREYEQNKIDRIPYLINQLSYLNLTSLPELLFSDQYCEVKLDVNTVKANTFDGIIGFLPNENDQGKLLVTGEIQLYLNNLFKSGKQLGLDWQKPNLLTQELYANYGHPAIFNWPVDLATTFSLFKQDTSFITHDFSIGFLFDQYPLGKFGVDYQRESSRLLSTSMLKGEEIPESIDFDINYYGLSYKLNTINQSYLPSGGISVKVSLKAGNKSILENTGIDTAFYKDLDPQTFQWRATMDIRKFIPLSRRNILLSRIFGGFLENENLFLNNMFRLGGLRTIRGFNEKSFFASKYIGGTLEYRYIFDSESQLVVFIDGSMLGYDLPDSGYRDLPLGVGAGFNLSTRAGILNIFYALGRSRDQPFSFTNSKIHIGYSNKF